MSQGDKRASPPVTVVIGDHTQGLGIVRSAALRGSQTWVVNDKQLSLARCSRRLTGYRRLRRGVLRGLDRSECVAELRQTLLQLPITGPAALFGVNEDITRFIHEQRSILDGRFFIPDVRLEQIYDKFAFDTLVPECARMGTRLCSEVDWVQVEHPERYLLKGRAGNGFRRLTGHKAIPLVDLSIARREALLADLSPTQVVLQDRIDTNRPIVSVCAFSICGRVNGLFGYEKLRQHPDRFGTGSYLRSVPVDAWKPVAEQILGTLHYTGISEIEFIHDPSRDAYRVIEMNPRPWKSVHFATQCGQNLVARHLSWVGGVEPEPGFEYATGRYWTDLATDLRQMLRERTLFRWNRGVFECTWDRSDPVPAVVLWTLFPLISWENHLEEREAAKRDGTGAFRWPASACVDVPVRMGSASGDSA